MTNDVISKALSRQLECPEIHKKVAKLKGSKLGFEQSVFDMVTDLKDHVPELSTRQLSSLVGVSRTVVMKALGSVEQENWTEDDNEASAAAELAALRKHHDKYRDDVSYTLCCGGKPDADEWSDVPALFTARPLTDPHRVADQSHTVKRPITIATRPFDIAA